MNISGDTRILHWNCCGIRSKLPQLQHIASNIDVICIQESMLKPHNQFWLKGFKVIRKDIVSPNQRGICMIIKDNLMFSNVDLSSFCHSSWEIQALTLYTVDDAIIIVNIYRHPNQFTPYNVYNQLLISLSNLCQKFIIMGDFNAHHPWWGCSYEDPSGKILSNVIDTHSLIVLNDRQSPTLFHPTARFSIIDLAITSDNMVTYCSSNTGHDTLGSDHFPVFITIEDRFKLKSAFLYKLKVNSKDLVFLQHSLYNSLEHFKNTLSNNYELAYETLEQHLKKHLYSLFPPKSCQPRSCAKRHKPPSPPWWNEICQQAIDERKKSIRAFFEHPTPANFTAYKQTRLKSTKTLKRQKRLGWQKFCSQMNHKTPTSEIWSLIKSFKRRKMSNPSSILLSDINVQTRLIKDTINNLCPSSCRHVVWPSLYTMEIKDQQLSNINHNLGQPFVETELRSAINSAKLNTAPGIDQIDNRVISSLPNEYYSIILLLSRSMEAITSRTHS